MGSTPSLALQAAFVAIASRIVASGFRVVESFNPKLQQRKVITDPPVVIKREVVTVGTAFLFSLVTNMAIFPFAEKRKLNKQVVMFFTSMIGSFLAETLGRVVAYRKAIKNEQAQLAAQPTAPVPHVPVELPPPPPEPARPAVIAESYGQDSGQPSVYYQPQVPSWPNAYGYGNYYQSYPAYTTGYNSWNTGWGLMR